MPSIHFVAAAAVGCGTGVLKWTDNEMKELIERQGYYSQYVELAILLQIHSF